VFATAAKIPASVSGRMSASHRSFGRNANPRLFGFLVRLTRRRDLAEDLLEETWLRFVTHASRLEADTRLGPWLFMVARNVHISHCRSRALDSRCTADAIERWRHLLRSPRGLRCHASLARQRRSQTTAVRSRTVRARVVDLAMAAAIGVYGVIAAIEAVRLTLVH